MNRIKEAVLTVAWIVVGFFAGMAADKKLHLIAGLIAGLLGSMWGVALLGLTGVMVFLSGLAVAGLAGVFKEIYDGATNGVVDYYDAVYTAVGGVPTAAILALAL